MKGYETFLRILRGSYKFEFDDDMKLTFTGRYTDESVLDFRNMNREIFEDLSVNDTSYEDSMRILAGSKRYEIEDTQLVVSSYYTGDEVRLELGNISETMYEELRCENEIDEDDDFAEAVDRMETQDDGVFL